MADRDAVLTALKGITDPVSGTDLMASGVVRALNVDDSGVRFVMEIAPSAADAYGKVKEQAEEALAGIGVAKTSIVLTGHQDKAPPDLKPQRPAEPKGPQKIPGVDRIVAIASGKGGVGKSTVSANLACALAQQGRRVGLLDADVYGPSQPRMLGVTGRPASPDGKIILPMRNHGVTMMSIGLMTNDDQAVVWRGPMLMGALQQMMMQVQWGALDVL
ncbi:MAG: P-loop NTPase, partial [Shimia sp.]